MKNLKLKLITLTCGLALGASAMAASSNSYNQLPKQKLTVGASVLAVNANHVNGWADKSTDGIFGRFFYNVGEGVQAGYAYQIAPKFYLGGELGLQSNGSTGQFFTLGTSNATDSTFITALLTTEVYITHNWSINGKFGPAFVMQQSSYWQGKDLNKINAKSHGVKPYISVGTTYYIGKFGIGVSYNHLFGSQSLDNSNLKDQPNYKMPIFAQNAIQLTASYTF
jgi:hypothetical protein